MNVDQPRLKNGQFISRDCPVCGYGRLQPEGRDWICNGLRDPERDDQELVVCDYGISGGEIVGTTP